MTTPLLLSPLFVKARNKKRTIPTLLALHSFFPSNMESVAWLAHRVSHKGLRWHNPSGGLSIGVLNRFEPSMPCGDNVCQWGVSASSFIDYWTGSFQCVKWLWHCRMFMLKKKPTFLDKQHVVCSLKTASALWPVLSSAALFIRGCWQDDCDSDCCTIC